MTSASPPSATKLSDRQFERTRRLALDLAGIELVERHREMLSRRSQRLGIQDSAALEGLLDAAEAGQREAREKIIHLLTTKFTGFFRHPHHFASAAQHALEAARQRGRARLWCAAAATGEEPYSLAMALIEVFGREDPPVRILATDVDPEALVTARKGGYSQAAVRALDSARRQRFLDPTLLAEYSRVADTVRELVEFRPLNLVSPCWPIEGPFDVVFARNVLMYLDPECRVGVLGRIASLLAPDGLLMLDPAEHLGRAAHLFKPGAAGVFQVCQEARLRSVDQRRMNS